MRTPSSRNRKKHLRRLFLGLLVVLTAMAQNVPWLPPIFGAAALPLIPIAVAIAVCDQTIPAIFFGAFAGALWDMNAHAHGFHGIYLTVVAFAAAMLMRYILNRNALTIGLLTFASTAIYLLLQWFADYAFLDGLSPAQSARPLLRYALPSLIYTLLLTPLCYTAVQAVVRKTSRKVPPSFSEDKGVTKSAGG